jgi:hypothetical protein
LTVLAAEVVAARAIHEAIAASALLALALATGGRELLALARLVVAR